MKRHRKIIYIAGFIFTIPLALTSYINSSFLEIYTDPYYVSMIYIISSLLSILALFAMPSVLSRIGNRIATAILGFVTVASFIALALSTNVNVILGSFVVHFVAINLALATLDIFMEDFSGHRSIGKTRGVYLTIINGGWVFSQLISGKIITASSFEGLYLVSALLMFVFSLIFVFSLHDFHDPKYKLVPAWKTLKIFLRNKHLSKIYTLSLILRFFFAWMVIYTPIYLSQYMGFAWNEIGLIFTIMLLPFVLLTFPLGRLSDKAGEKKFLILGFGITSLATLLIPLIEIREVWIWALVLFATRVGAAMIEIMTESYFFKCVTEENADAISFFRNTGPVSYVIGPIAAIPILYLVPSFEHLFYVLGTIVLFGFFVTLRLRDVK